METASAGTSSPCGACKFLRRKCATDCVFAPYFCSEQGPARFAAIHKVFGASNFSKLLLHIPLADRCEAVVNIAYEAQARIRDPVYGCVAHIFALQQQVACLQAQLMQLKSQMAQSLIDSRNAENQWPTAGNYMAGMAPTLSPAYINPSNYNYMNSSVSPQSSLESNIDHLNNDGMNMQETQCKDDQLFSLQAANYSCINKKRPASQTDLNELQALAFRMMKN